MNYYHLQDWTLLRFTGADRQKFVHNFCTNEVRKLTAGQGCEAFICDVKGHTIGQGWLLAAAEQLWLLSVPEQGSFLHQHFDRYLIREQVEIANVTADYAVFCLRGQPPELATTLSSLPQPWQHMTVKIAGIDVIAVNCNWLQEPSWIILVPQAQTTEIQQWLQAQDQSLGSHNEFESQRIAAKTPLFGHDIKPENLPQEIQRDQQAISFTKGCYLGQETVARIDALGQVNKLLVGFSTTATTLTAGTELLHDGKPVGRITSIAAAVDQPGQIGLALVKRLAASKGTRLDIDHQSVTVQ